MSYRKRQEFNRLLLKLLTEVVENNPDLRFNQILYNLDIDAYDVMGSGSLDSSEESEETFKRVLESPLASSVGFAKTMRVLYGRNK
jgi:hypothetical protein